MIERTVSATREPLAIVGIGCRLPGANLPAELWQLLVEGRSAVREVPGDRWNADRFYHENNAAPGKMVSRWGGFVENLKGFDAAFWGISPREANRMDPQQRWMLEVAWEALEDAGVAPSSLSGRNVGVFAGVASNDYGSLQLTDYPNIDMHTNSGGVLSIAANRISYLLNLKGPSIAVDTACSSALVAATLACQSIWAGECEAALTGGCNALITPHSSIGFSKASMLSPSGKCYAFDARADGYVRAEGAALLFIKPLSAALTDNDRVYAVIRAAVTNQDGHTSTMTVPGLDSQAALLERAYRDAAISPADVCYVEAHGTGTPVGDPIEATALGKVLGRGRSADAPCLMGSIKTNIGHMESGSGVAGLLKATLVLQQGVVPANLNFREPSPDIAFEQLRLKVPQRNEVLCEDRGPLTASVNSFGFGGANAHIVLQQPPKSLRRLPHASAYSRSSHATRPTNRVPGASGANGDVSTRPASRPHLLPVSAKSEAALAAYAQAYRNYLTDTDAAPSDVCFTAATRKERHPHWLAVVGKDTAAIGEEIERWLAGEETPDITTGSNTDTISSLTFVYTGQGPQWWGMGQKLLRTEPVFAAAASDIDTLFQQLAGWSLLQEMSKSEDASQINRTSIAQPAIFAVQVGLTELWKSWGVQPEQTMGHSVGEVAAAYIAGIYSLEDAVRIIYHRSRLQQQTDAGGMMAVGANAADASRLIADTGLEITAINSPSLVTLGGDVAAVQSLAARLKEQGVFHRVLPVNFAFHTTAMDSIKQQVLDSLSNIKPQPGRIPFISTVTGNAFSGEKMDAHYWWRNIRQPVLFAPAMQKLLAHGDSAFLELGPHPSLRSSMEQCMTDAGANGQVFHSLKRSGCEQTEMLASAAQLHFAGVDVNWHELSGSNRTHLPLPAYPWQHESFWLEPTSDMGRTLAEVHPLLGQRSPHANPTWRTSFDARVQTYLEDHRMWDGVVFPASAYAEIGAAIADELFPGEPYVVEDLQILQAMFINAGESALAQITFDQELNEFSVLTTTGDNSWDLHARGRLVLLKAEESPERCNFDSILQRMQESIGHQRIYEEFAASGYQFGPKFSLLQKLHRSPGEALADISVPPEIQSGSEPYRVHPAVLDAFIQSSRGLQIVPPTADPQEYFFLPDGMHRVKVYADHIPARLRVHASLVRDAGSNIVADLIAYDEAGNRVADILGFSTTRRENKKSRDDVENNLYQFKFTQQRLPGSGSTGTCNFPAPESLAAALLPATEQAYDARGLHQYYQQFMPVMQRVVLQLVQNAFLELGWDFEPGQRFTPRDVVKQLRIAYQHRRLTAANLNWLVEAGFLSKTGESYAIEKPLNAGSINADLEKLTRYFAPFAAEIRLVQQVGMRLAEVFGGTLSAVDLLFPHGANDLLEDFYTTAGDFPVYSKLLQEVVSQLTSQLPPRRTLRVLEVGAGTGSLTRELLPLLPAERCEYHFTDVSPAFLTAARNQFADFPFVEFQSLDIEKAPGQHGPQAESFDIVLATNVLHATRDLQQSLANASGYLADDGLLIFLEVVRARPVWDNTFGLLPGWWRFTDRAAREESPLLDRSGWEELLAAGGFQQVQSFICSPSKSEGEQAVFIAKAPERARATQDNAKHADNTAVTLSAAAPVVVIKGQAGVSERVAEQLRTRGETVLTVQPGEAFADLSNNEFQTGVGEDRYDALFLHECLQANPPSAIVHFLCLDHVPAGSLGADRIQQQQQTGVLDAMRLVQALQRRYPEQTPRLYFVTRGSQAVAEDDQVCGMGAAPLLGLVRVLNNEHADYATTLVDLDTQSGEYEVDMLAEEIVARSEELEIAIRSDQRYVNRLQQVKLPDFPQRQAEVSTHQDKITPYRLQTSQPGSLANLSLNETVRRAPGPHEIEVEVKAAGINFRDVMKALGIYPGDPVDRLWLGDDFSGVVLQTGEQVDSIRVGEQVTGMAPYCFGSHVTVDARMTFATPADASFEQAATLPTVFLTAHYAIEHLARARRGESILIHAATGGVGQAAVQIAQHLGLKIFATAGTPEKRHLLRDMGVEHVMNSRTVEFADQIQHITDGIGVDIVLNSLAGEFIPKSFSVLSPFGRFLEIGKVDIYQDTKFGLSALRNNISYFVIDLAQHLEKKPEFIAQLFRELHARFTSGAYQPLPHRSYPITAAQEAFRYMAQGKHVGKNVLSFEVDKPNIGPCTQQPHLLRPDATYLITGGTSGFGLELVKWMASHGARSIAVMSRSGPQGEAMETLRTLRESGIQILDKRGDVTSATDVENLVQQIQRTMPELKGVVHGAMVLDDDFVTSLNESRFNTALHPKMLGAWNLHQSTKELELEQFVCFSSFSSVMGAVRQANYNAGNTFLDALAAHRRAMGLCGLTINWGALSGAGFVARNEKTAAYLEKIGLFPFSIAEALNFFGQCLSRDTKCIAASRVDWQTLSRLSPAIANTPTYKAVMLHGAKDNSGACIRNKVLSAATHERPAVMEQFLVQQVADVFNIEAAKVDRRTPLTKLGLDSLMAVDLMNRVEGELAIKFPMGNVLNGPDIQTLAAQLLATLTKSATGQQTPAESNAANSDTRLTTVDTTGRQYPLTTIQQRLLQSDFSADGVAIWAKLNRLLNASTLQQAVDHVVASQQVLRTIINGKDAPQQTVADEQSVNVQVLDAGNLEKQVDEFLQQRFHLDQAAVLRVALATEDNASHLLLLGAAPLLDGVSLGLLLEEVLSTYKAIDDGETPHATNQPGYFDYLSWYEIQQEDVDGEAADFWTQALHNAPAGLMLPRNGAVPNGGPREQAEPGPLEFCADIDLSHQTGTAAAHLGATVEDFVFATLQLVLHRATRQSDLLLGAVDTGRDMPMLKAVVGRLASIVPFRSDLDESATFVQLLEKTAGLRAKASTLKHALDDVSIELDGETEFDLCKAFTALFEFTESPLASNFPVQATRSGFEVQMQHAPYTTQRASLNLRMSLFDGELHGAWDFDAGLIDRTTVSALSTDLLELLKHVCRHPQQQLSNLPRLPDVASPTKTLPRIDVRRKTQIEFGAECQLEPSITPGAETRKGQPEMLVLTGATGFLGAFLLDELLRTTTFDIVCPVRAVDEATGLQRICDNLASLDLPGNFADRVKALPADLSLPRLGLDEDAFDRLADAADVILHNAASVNLSLPYESLRQTNVAGTREILKLACQGVATPLHYVSTFTVHTASHTRQETVSEASELPAADSLLHGYSQTKWVSEKLLETARQRGLPVSIYRPGHITGHSQTGMANTADLLHSLVRLCLEVGAAPRRETSFDLTPVDYVAGSLVKLLRQRGSANQTYLLTNPQPLESPVFAGWLSQNYDELEVTSYASWRDRVLRFAEQVEDGGALRPLIDTLAPRVLDGAHENTTAVHPLFKPYNTLQALAGSGIECPPADMALLSVYMKFYLKMGFAPSKHG